MTIRERQHLLAYLGYYAGNVAEEVMGATGELGLYDWGIHVGIGKYSRFNG